MTKVWMEKYRPTSESEMIGCSKLRNVINEFLDEAIIELKRVRKKNQELKNGINETAVPQKKKTVNASIAKWMGGSQTTKPQRDRIRTKNISKQKKKKHIETPDTKKTAILLRGSPGIGKTTVVYAIANDRKFPVSETNASDARTVSKIKELISPAAKSRDISLYFTRNGNDEKNKDRIKIVMIDEVDGISGKAERGGVSELADIIKTSMYPIIMISNEWKSNLKPIYKICREYDVERPSTKEIAQMLRIIAKKEKMNISDNEILIHAKNANGDFRAGINNLQTGNSSIRDQLDNIFDSIKKFFTVRSKEEANKILRSAPINHEEMFARIIENIDGGTDNKNAGKICDIIAKTDTVIGYIHKTQEWSMFPMFIDLLKTSAVMFTKSPKWLTNPKWFSSNNLDTEAMMNEYNICAQEGKMLGHIVKKIN